MLRHSRRAALLAALLAIAAFASMASTASAAPCSAVLFDAAGFAWDPIGTGEIENGFGDAYDDYGALAIDGTAYPAAAADACGREDGDREVTYPEAALSGLNVSRKVYVPAEDRFVRWLDILTNPTQADISVSVRFSGSLGSDSDTRVRATASGDTTADAADRWIVTDDALMPDTVEDPVVGHAFDSTLAAPDTFDAFTNTFADADDSGAVEYQNVVVPAGATFVFLHAGYQGFANEGDEAVSATQRLARGPAGLYTGMSAGERAALRNFPADGDGDGDGLLNAADNCPDAINVDQRNSDGTNDGGDACDIDDDNDGHSDAVEASVETDPTRFDTDGDGVRDGIDRCPRDAGNLANGCSVEDRPPNVAFAAPAENAALRPSGLNTLTATATDDIGVQRVVFVDDGRVICDDSTAPYTCAYAPEGRDVGSNTLSAMAVDSTNQTATAYRVVTLRRFAPTAVTARTTPAADATVPFRFTTTGRVALPARVDPAQGCRGRVSVQIQSRGSTVSTRRASLTRQCTYRSRVAFTVPERLYGTRLTVKVRFLGNQVLSARAAPVRRVRVG